MRKTILITLAVTGMIAWSAGPALALTVDPDPGIDMVNGNVYALQAAGPWMYVGGKFDEIKNSNGKNLCPGDELVRFDESSGAADCSWTPAIPGTYVHGIAVLNGYVYAGGNFGLVKVSESTGAVDPSFTVSANNVHAVTAAPDGSGTYIGGAFNRVNGKSHHNIAFVSTSGAVSSTFQGNLDGTVRHIRISPNGYLVPSGSFTAASGHADQSIAELDESDGSPNTSFSPEIPEVGAMQCFDTAPTVDTIYAACGQSHNFMAAFDATTGKKLWRKGIGGNGESASLTDVNRVQTLFIGGHMGTRDSKSQPCGSTFLHGVMKVDPSNGAIDCTWDPTLMPDTHNYTGGWVQEVVNGHLWLGGRFSTVDGVTHHGIARWTL